MNGPPSATESQDPGTPRGTGTTELPDAVHRLCQELAEASWYAGYDTAVRDVAAKHVELEDAWRPIGRVTHERRVAERLALFDQCAAQLAEQMGRPGYVYGGGPVDWHTGQPVRHLKAVS